MPWFSQTEVSGSLSHVLALKILATLYTVFWLVSFHHVTLCRPQKDLQICYIATNNKEVKFGH